MKFDWQLIIAENVSVPPSREYNLHCYTPWSISLSSLTSSIYIHVPILSISSLPFAMYARGVLPMMAYRGRLRPKGVSFSGFRYRWFSRYVIAAMLMDGKKTSLISSLCLSTAICSFHHCYLCLPRLLENHLYKRVGVSLVQVYKWVGQSVIWVCERAYKG